MTRRLVTGNQAAGYVLAAAGDANREARGCCAGAYPITPQTEIAEYLSAHTFVKGDYVAVESEHSAMAVCMGASLNGARSFTATSANGLLYMAENVFVAGYCRLPIVMVVSNRTLGPPWNIWVDQGDSLAVRDAAWVQLYCESHQDLVDSILLAFRVAEDKRVLLPALVAQDGFILSHTLMGADLPEQELVDTYLPKLDLAQRLRDDRPVFYGNITSPRDTQWQREEVETSMAQVPHVLREAVDEFESVFGRRPDGAVSAEDTSDAEDVLVVSGSMVKAARAVVRARRAAGGRVGLLKVKLFRPFPRERIAASIGNARRVAVLDRNLSAGSGGIFWGEVAASVRSSGPLVQSYLVGLGGADVTEAVIDGVLSDVRTRTASCDPIFFNGDEA